MPHPDMDKNKPVADIMTTELVVVHPDDSARKVQQIFNDNDFHHIPVVEGEHKLVGIISKEDFFRLAYALSLDTTGPTYSKHTYDSLTARNVMTRYPIHLDADDDIGLAADIFLANRFHALPIVDNGQLVGIVTTHDLLAHSFSVK